MYSRVFKNGGELYKETSLITDEGYIRYEFEGNKYIAKPGKVYLEAFFEHPGFLSGDIAVGEAHKHPDFAQRLMKRMVFGELRSDRIYQAIGGDEQGLIHLLQGSRLRHFRVTIFIDHG